MKIPSQNNNFRLKSDSESGFKNREKALFDQLSEVEKSFNKNVNNEQNDSLMMIEPYRRSLQRRKIKSEASQFLGQESIFKQSQPHFCKNVIPDYHKNPQKWTKYTLDDIMSDDISDKKNTQVALSFMKELKARKSLDSKKKESSSSSSSSSASTSSAANNITFKKPMNKLTSNVNNPEVINDHKPFYRGSKMILPEYVVGQKKNKTDKQRKKNKTNKLDYSKQLKLDHLDEFYDDEDN